MYYLLFPVYLLVLYSVTYLGPHASPPENIVMTAQQKIPVEQAPLKQAATGDKKSSLMAPSESVETKKGKGLEQPQESGISMMAPSESLEKKGEVNTSAQNNVQQQEPDIPLMAPSAFPEKNITAPQGKPAEQAVVNQPATGGEMSAMASPSDTVAERKEALPDKAEALPAAEGKKETSTKASLKAFVFILLASCLLFI